MKLNPQQLQAVTVGAAQLQEYDGGFRFCRLTKEQEEVYKAYDVDLYHNASSSADIRLSFQTDSPWLELEGYFLRPSKITRGVLDVTVDGRDAFCVKSHDDDDAEAALAAGERPDQLDGGAKQEGRSRFFQRLLLGEGTKTVQVYLSWCKPTVLTGVSLADGCSFTPVRKEKKMLVFGDSLTQGYYVDRNLQAWLHKLADALEVEACSKAVGGEVHFPALARCKEPVTPDYILVAYGTNDWTRCTREEFDKNVPAFYEALKENYPNAKIVTLLPMYNHSGEEIRKWGGTLEQLRQALKEFAERYGAAVVNCVNCNSRDKARLAAGAHPDALGYAIYAQNLIPAVKAVME